MFKSDEKMWRRLVSRTVFDCERIVDGGVIINRGYDGCVERVEKC